MLVSTFELLVKPQLPRATDFTDPAGNPIPVVIPTEIERITRTVIQGYFLTISNLNAFDVTLSLVFTIISNPPLDIANLVGFLDVNDINLNELDGIQPDFSPNKIRYTRTIKEGVTGLFLLQPNILPEPNNPGQAPALLLDANFEVRGYVEVFISSLSTGYNAAKLLLTPEHRGTFYSCLTEKPVQLDQIAYALPTAHGGSLFELTFH
jgi:hypothetical protein